MELTSHSSSYAVHAVVYVHRIAGPNAGIAHPVRIPTRTHVQRQPSCLLRFHFALSAAAHRRPARRNRHRPDCQNLLRFCQTHLPIHLPPAGNSVLFRLPGYERRNPGPEPAAGWRSWVAGGFLAATSRCGRAVPSPGRSGGRRCRPGRQRHCFGPDQRAWRVARVWPPGRSRNAVRAVLGGLPGVVQATPAHCPHAAGGAAPPGRLAARQRALADPACGRSARPGRRPAARRARLAGWDGRGRCPRSSEPTRWLS